MHDTMTEPHEAAPFERPVRQRRQHRECSSVIRGGHHAVMQRLAIGGSDQQTALPADPFHLAALQAAQCAIRQAVHGKFQAGRTGIQNAQTTILHPSWPFMSGACMLAI